MKYFGVIGDQEVDDSIKPMMLKVSKYLTEQGYTCVHGGNMGTEMTFAKGAKYEKMILPWNGFNHMRGPIHNPPQKAYDLAAEVYPKWWKASKGMKKILARNAQVIFGENLDSPVEFLMTWGNNRITEHAESLARLHYVPVYNLSNVEYWKIMGVLNGN